MQESLFSDVPTENRLREYRLLSGLLNVTGILTTWVFAWIVRDVSPSLSLTCIIVSSLTAAYRMISLAMSLKRDTQAQIRYYETGTAASGVLTGSIGVCAFIWLPSLPVEYYGSYSAWAFVCAATVTIAASPISRFAGGVGILATFSVAIVLFMVGKWPMAVIHLVGSMSFAALGFFLNSLFVSQEQNRKKVQALGRRTESTMKWFLREAQDWAFETDKDLNIIFASENVKSILGRSSDSVQGSHLLSIVEMDGRHANNDDAMYRIR
ncbi:MAG: PAS domain-containing protein, partial [Pseudomonadota bacterium]